MILGRLGLFFLLLLVSALLHPVAWTEEGHDAIPAIEWCKTVTGEPQALWASADRAADPKGNIDWDLLGDDAKTSFQTLLVRRSKHLARAGADDPFGAVTLKNLPSTNEGCLNLAEYIRVKPPSGRPLLGRDELIDQAITIFEGTVVETKGGLFRGNPGSLLKVEFRRALKEPMGAEIPPIVFVYHFNGRFRLGRHEFCNQHPLFPYVPRVGDTVIVFSSSGPADPSFRFFSPNEIVVAPQNGGLLMTQRMASIPEMAAAKSSYDVEQIVHRILTRDRSEESSRDAEW